MKRFVLVAIFLLVGAINAFGQSTTVSGTVTDVGAQAWAGGSYQFQFVPNPQFPVGPYTWTGGALTNVISGTLDGSGHYSQSVPSNSAISPVGSKWILQVTPNATSSSFSTAPTSITGGTQTLNVTPPAITVTVSTSVSGPLPRAYADAEISPGAIVGTEYYNTTSATIRVCQAVTGQSCTTWAAVGTGAGGPPTGPAGGDLSGTYPNPTVAQVNGGVVPTSAAVVGTNGSKQIVSAPLPTVTTGFIPKAGADTTLANTIVNSLCDEGITTANTLTCTDTAGIVSPLFSGSLKNNQFQTSTFFSGGTIPTSTFGTVIFKDTPTSFTYNGCGAPGANDGQRITFYNFQGGNYVIANATPGINTFIVPNFGAADQLTFIGGANGGDGAQFECRGGTLFYVGGSGFIPSFSGTPGASFIVGANGVAGALLGLQGATSGECDLTPNATGTSLASSCPITGLTAPTFPLTVAGTVTSGGIPYFNSTTQESSSALLTANSPVLGGGAGTAPSTKTFLTTNGTNEFDVGVAGGGSGALGLLGTTSGTFKITAPSVAGTSTNPATITNAMTWPIGATATPTINFTGFTNYGFWFDNRVGAAYSSNGGEEFAISGTGNLLGTDGTYEWASTLLSTGISPDTGLSRISAGVVGVGNGSQGNVTGTLQSAKYQTGTNCSSSASPAVCASAAAGSVALPTGTNPTLVVNTTAITANSQIFLTVDEGLGTKLGVTCNTTLSTLLNPVVTARSAGVSFTFTIGAIIATNPACVSYLIFN